MNDELAHLRETFGFAGISRRAAAKAWDESRVNRHPAGDPRGGQFAPKDGAGDGATERVIDANGPDFVAPFVQFAEQDNAGEPVYFLTTRGVSDAAREKALTAFFGVPEYARAGIANVVLHEEEGYEFEAGGKRFEAAGNYDVRGAGGPTINIFNANYLEDDPIGMKRIIDHECGHNLEQRMRDLAAEQDRESWDKSPELFDFQGNILDIGKARRLYPAATARMDYYEARRKGALGLTPYSQAWNNDSEIIADAYKVYRTPANDAERKLAMQERAYYASMTQSSAVSSATRELSESLFDWFEAMKDNHERKRQAQ